MKRRAWTLAAILLAGAALAGGKVLADLGPVGDGTIQEQTQDKVEEKALRYLGRTPAAELVYVYKAADIARQIGVAGVEAKDRRLESELVAQAEVIEILKARKAAGADLNHDPVAQAIKHRLEAEGATMSAEGLSDTDFILTAVIQHPVYAVGKVAAGKAAEETVVRVLKRYGGKWGARWADKLAHTAGDLVDQGWPALADRAERSDYVAALQKAAQAHPVSPATVASQAEAAVLDDLPAEIAHKRMDAALAIPDPTVARRAFVLAMIRPVAAQPETLPPPVALPQRVAPAVPAQPFFFPAPVRLVPALLPIRPVLPPPEAPLPPPISNRDLLYRSIEREDHLERGRSEAPAQPTNSPTPSQESSGWEMSPQLKEEMACVGSRRAGCEKYNSTSGGDGGSVNYSGNFHATRND